MGSARQGDRSTEGRCNDDVVTSPPDLPSERVQHSFSELARPLACGSTSRFSWLYLPLRAFCTRFRRTAAVNVASTRRLYPACTRRLPSMVSIMRRASIFCCADRACATNRARSAGLMSSSRAGSVPRRSVKVRYAVQASSRSPSVCVLQAISAVAVLTCISICDCCDVGPASVPPEPPLSAVSEHVSFPCVPGGAPAALTLQSVAAAPASAMACWPVR
jgi:hypothetical protein